MNLLENWSQRAQCPWPILAMGLPRSFLTNFCSDDLFISFQTKAFIYFVSPKNGAKRILSEVVFYLRMPFKLLSQLIKENKGKGNFCTK